jgi:hypothetical protein
VEATAVAVAVAVLLAQAVQALSFFTGLKDTKNEIRMD